MLKKLRFRVSKHLKDIIGRELVTNKFVAVFELVKNSIDARATSVQIEFDLKNDRIFIVDDGIGMTQNDIINKWLFVAYSEKAEKLKDNEKSDYRKKIQVAGRKGIGRFSCDTLGSEMNLYTKPLKGNLKHPYCLHIDWTVFENDNRSEFSDAAFGIISNRKFPELQSADLPVKSGTVIEISNLRETWQPDDIRELRTSLAKLVDPFNISKQIEISTFLSGSNLGDIDLNGRIGNNITNLLTDKTSRIQVVFHKGEIVTELHDRGTLIFRVSEPNKFKLLQNCRIDANVYYLNRSAKILFKKRMGLACHEYGSIFLFLNGFRVFPVGEESDDSFGINRRKQQSFGQRLGTRDILGRIDVVAAIDKFREVSSRDAGLIKDANYLELQEAILEKLLYPLERYVVGVNWKDDTDKDSEDFKGFESDSVKSNILKILGKLARNSEIKILEYDDKIININNDKVISTDAVMKDLMVLAKRENNVELIERVKLTQTRLKELEEVEKQAKSNLKKNARELEDYDALIGALKKEKKYLEASQNLDVEDVQLLLHQNHLYAHQIRASTMVCIKRTKNLLRVFEDTDHLDLKTLIAICRSRTEEILDPLSSITLQNKKLSSVLRFATHLKSVQNYKMKANLIEFLSEYFDMIYYDIRNFMKIEYTTKVSEFYFKFLPFDFAIIFDNLIDNSIKANARKMWIDAKYDSKKEELELLVCDNGRGIETASVDTTRIFNKFYSSTLIGTGLGLYHVKKVINEMGGDIVLVADSPVGSSSEIVKANFRITLRRNIE